MAEDHMTCTWSVFLGSRCDINNEQHTVNGMLAGWTSLCLPSEPKQPKHGWSLRPCGPRSGAPASSSIPGDGCCRQLHPPGRPLAFRNPHSSTDRRNHRCSAGAEVSAQGRPGHHVPAGHVEWTMLSQLSQQFKCEADNPFLVPDGSSCSWRPDSVKSWLPASNCMDQV